MRAADTEPHKPIDRSQKNTDLLRRLDVLTGAMNQVPTKRKVKTRVTPLFIIFYKHIIEY